MEADPKRILQSATNPSFRMMYKNPAIDTQKRETIDTLEHALAIHDVEPSKNLSGNAAAQPHLNTQKLRAIMR